ncbi:MAG TPA: 50S ribosomal protein L23 [Candidatus Nanoarchaeia archaeon]|nr:50S ribosomal protein L23 [Candidatus Nanoarchaeia archaeon]
MKPIATEKAVMKIESENLLTFQVDSRKNKDEIKKEIEEMFEVKVAKVRTNTRGNKKIAYIRLNKDYPAMDVATKLGIM